MLSQLAESFLSEEQRQQPDYPQEWRLRYGEAIAHLQCHGIEIAEDIEAGADAYVELRSKWNRTVVAFAHYMKYRWSDITSAE